MKETAINLRQLRYFAKVVEARNITRAAEQLNVAQPALGLKIRQLEDLFGVPLLHRHSRGVDPTPAGELLYARAHATFSLLEQTRADVQRLGQPTARRLTLGLTPSLVMLVGAEAVLAAHQQLENIWLSLREDPSFVLADAVENRQVDVALAYAVPERPGLALTPVLSEELLLVTRASQAPEAETVTLEQALSRPMAHGGKRDAGRCTVAARGENAGLSDDVDAYDLILKDKERLLSFTEPVRFIFSHSALREGWDNPNVFVICALKHSDNTISRRQEVGRGLRLSVNQHGDRMDHPSTVHDINVLTVVASESYKDFVAALQKDISESLSARPRLANEAYFTGKVLKTATGDVEITPQLAKQIYKYLLKHDYTDDADRITTAYHEAKKDGALAALPPELAPHAEQVFKLIDSVFSESQLPEIGDDRKPKKNPLNANFEKQEFKELWNRINRKAAYSVDFDSDELVQKAVKELDASLRVTPLQYIIEQGEQAAAVTYDGIKTGNSFELKVSETETNRASIHSAVKYDLIGKLAEGTQLTRRTVVEILKGLNVAVFAQFKTNPESFIAEAIRLINEQKATVIIEHLAYDPVEDKFDLDIFTAGQTNQDFSNAVKTPKHHIYDFVLPDSGSKPERDFAEALEASAEVVVYAKLPRGFLIPTPVGDYNPDWAISFKEGAVKHIYFVAETKGSMSSMDLREIEKTKIKCARKFFDEMNRRFAPENVKYDVVDSFGKLMEVVK